MSDSELESIRQRWTRRLSGLRLRLRWHQAAEAFALLLAGTVLTLLLTGLIDYRFELSTAVRRLVLLVCGGVLAYSAWQRLLRPLLAKLDLIDVAAIIDRAISLRSSSDVAGPVTRSTSESRRPNECSPDERRPGHRPGRLTASVARVLDPSNEQSPLLHKAIAQSDETLSHFDMDQALDGRHLGKNLAGTIATLIVPIAIAFAIPSTTKVWAARWIGGDNIAYPRNTSLEVVGLKAGLLQVPRGEPARISVKATDKSEPTTIVWMRLDPTDGDSITSTLDAYGASDDSETASHASSDFRGEIPPLASTTSASVWGGDARPLRFRIDPVDRPQVVSLDLVARHPAENEPREFDLTSASDVRILRDSVAKLTVTSTAPVTAQFDSAVALESKQIDKTTFEITWTHRESTSIRVALTSTESSLESFPRTATIGLLPDRSPSVTLRHSGVRLRVTPIATIPLSVTARDDFGVDRLVLNGDTVRMKIPVLNEKSSNDTTVEEATGDEATGNATENDDASETETPEPDATATPDDGEVTSPNNEPPPASDDRGASEAVDPNDSPESAVASGNATATKPTTPPPAGTGPIVLFESTESPELRVDREHRLELAPLAMKPGDVVKVSATATDAAYGGAQERQSRTITFRVVKEEDLFREIKLRLQQLRARLRKATDAADEFRLEIVKAELPKAGSGLSRKYQVSRREIGAVAQQIRQAAVELELNRLGGADAKEVNEQLQKTVVMPLDRLLAGTMNRQRITLGDLAKTRGPKLETNREEAVTRQEEIVASLNEVLKNMNQWDSFVDVVNQLNFVLKKQVEVHTGIKTLNDGEAPDKPTTDGSPNKSDKPKANAADDIFDN